MKKPSLREQNARLRARIHELRAQLKSVDKRSWELVHEIVDLRNKVSWSAQDTMPHDPDLNAHTDAMVEIVGEMLNACRARLLAPSVATAKVLLMYAADECMKLGMDRDEFLIAADYRFHGMKEARKQREAEKATERPALHLVPNQPEASA